MITGTVDKEKLTDDRGNPLTQSLFLEIGYMDYYYFALKKGCAYG
jgi:hypothetical protein